MLQRNELRSHNESERTPPPASGLTGVFQAVELFDEEAEVAQFALDPAKRSDVVFHLCAQVFVFEARDVHQVARCHPAVAVASLLDAELGGHDELLSKTHAEVGFRAIAGLSEGK